MLCIAVVFCSEHTVCYLLSPLTTSLWTHTLKLVFTNAYLIYCVMLECTAEILSGLHPKAWLSLAAGPASQHDQHCFCRPD